MAHRAQAAVLGVTAAVLVSKALGFLREVVVADRFGTSAQYDAYLIAIIPPAMFYGVLNYAGFYFLVPFITRKLQAAGFEDKRQRHWSALWSAMNTWIIGALIIAGLIWISAPVIMRIWAGHYDPATFSQVIYYTRLMSVIVILGTMEALQRAYLNVRWIQVYPAMGFVVFNTVAIAGIILLHGEYGVGAIAIGFIAGLVAQNLLLAARLGAFGAFGKAILSFQPEDARAVLSVGGMLLLIEAVNRSYFLIDRYFAPGFGDGVVSALAYDQVLITLPEAVIGFAVGAVLYPRLAAAASGTDQAGFDRLYRRAVTAAVLLGVPIAAVMIAGAEELVRLVFARGAFDEESVRLTAEALRYFAPSVIALFVISMSIRACYSRGMQKLVLIAAASMLVLKYLATLVAIQPLGYRGIPLASSLAYGGLGIAMFMALRSGREGLRQAGVISELLRILVAGAVATTLMLVLGRQLGEAVELEHIHLQALVQLVIIGAATALAYGVALLTLGMGRRSLELLAGHSRSEGRVSQ
jgi:putative peptidoglycan lipid II flippase